MDQPNRFLTAKEAAELLNITIPTLYAYVSRGLIRSEPTGAKKRTNRYHAEDILRLKERQEQRRNPAQAAASALHFGQPVLESAITLIADGRLYYRGHDAITLARTYTLEEIAVLLWDEMADQPPLWQTTAANLFSNTFLSLPYHFKSIQQKIKDLTPMEQFQILLPLVAASDYSAYDYRPQSVRQTGAKILNLLAAIASGNTSNKNTIAATLQQGWLPQEPQAEKWLNETLILCADHELNLSAFTARCVASGETTLYGVISAGLAALQGAKHGGFTDRVESLFREVAVPEQAQTILKNRLKRGDAIPGFSHPLYPKGDPRGQALLALAEKACPNSTAVHLSHAIAAATMTLIGQHPTLDFGLVTLSNALNLPSGSPLALFAIGRTAGWIGHALEQQTLKQLIRPRAKYTGPTIK